MLIAEAHHQAMKDVLRIIERDVAMTRIGTDGPRGAVAQVEVRGVVAAAYDHYDSRTSDPQLHTHVVIANRVQGVHDGKWRTHDSRALHAAVTGLSEHYNAVLSDHLTRLLDVSWEEREREAGRMLRWEVAGVPQVLMDVFSSRTFARCTPDSLFNTIDPASTTINFTKSCASRVKAEWSVPLRTITGSKRNVCAVSTAMSFGEHPGVLLLAFAHASRGHEQGKVARRWRSRRA